MRFDSYITCLSPINLLSCYPRVDVSALSGGRLILQNQAKRYFPLVILSLFLILIFENCGVQQPKVEGGTLSLSSMSPESHKSLPSDSKCATCHESARPQTLTFSHSFDHKNSQWNAQDCKSCHINKETWGLTWTQGQFAHEPQPDSCLQCHTNQMPKTQILVENNPLRPFTHTAGSECVTCHSNTSRFDQLSDWRPAFAQPSGLIGSKNFSIQVVTPTFSGAVMSRSLPFSQNLKLEVDHGHSLVGSLACATCHGSASNTGSFKNALFHRNISTNPTSCVDCHTNARPKGAVGSKGFMRHEAVSWVSNEIGVVSRGSTAIVGTECATCHLNTSSMPQAGANPPSPSLPFSGASFHLNSSGASLTSCLDCHAHSRPANSTNFTDPVWRNKTNVGAPPFTTFNLSSHAPNVDCATCHSPPGVASSSSAHWANGYFQHTSANLNCLNCHTNSGVTSTNHSGFNSNCVTCHAGSTTRFPSPLIGDWKVNVTGGVPVGIVGEKVIANATKCSGVLGSTPNCTPANPNTIVKGYNHTINSKSVSCQNCHGLNGASASNGKFHTAPTGIANWIAPAAADISNCTSCHDPTSPPLNVVSIRNVGMVGSRINLSTGASPFAGVFHGHALISGQQCSNCHTTPTPNLASNWNVATQIHGRFSSTQLTTCTECHYKRMPSGVLNRKNQVVYKGTHQPQKFTHTSTSSLPTLASQQCSTCHSSANLSWTAAGTVSFHNKVTSSQNCNLCHIAPSGSVTSQTSGISFNHSLVANIGDCVSCHQASVARVAGRIPTALDWDGGTAAPATYTIPNHTSQGITVPGFTGTHSSNSNCVTCHGTGNYKVITDFDHQGLPAGQNSCVSCHLGSKADVSAFIASTSGITMKTAGDRHHPTSIFNGKSTSCVGCHTVTRGASTFTNANGIVYPTAARQAYVSVGCGSVNGSTFSCHEDGQRTMTVPVSTGTSGKWK